MLTVRKQFSIIILFFIFVVITWVFIKTILKLSGGLVQTEFFNLLPTFIEVVKTIEASSLRPCRGRGMTCNACDGCNDIEQNLGHFQPITRGYNWKSAARQDSGHFINY